ncbi:glycosyltransferase family 2 protein [Microvirga sp. TS319]|uniref:glycosyltransferase family 2 protein n=1 Tax=Microvirga sp. TS319 TaxID=3241165 RepID=UPI00351A240F
MRILAVAVTYNPDTGLLARVLDSIASQIDGIAVVDNGSVNMAEIGQIAQGVGAQVLSNSQNLGIAAAQNQGIALARKDGFTHVLLLDQDTILAPGVVADLAHQLSLLERDHGKVSAIGPAYFERHSKQQTRAYRANGLRLLRISLENQARPIASDSIIASGSLIPLAVLEQVGEFKEDLFIDLVDVEWCFRARAAGFAAFIAPSAVVDHHLGSGTVKIGRRQIAVHTPVRNYYWVRNALWLARQPYTPLAWRLYFISRSLAFLGAYTTLVDKKRLRLQLMGRGIRDSFIGRFGRIRP